MIKPIKFTTSDKIEIFGIYEKVDSELNALLLHMMPATKESWQPFMQKLAENDISSLAIDERGHGESTMRDTIFYKNFIDEEQQAKIYDVKGGLDFLKIRGATFDQLFVIGASIGANLSIEILKYHPDIKKSVALSPGIDYHGVLTEPVVLNLAQDQSVLIIASDDDHYAFESMHKLKELNPDQVDIIETSGIGHGTTMFEKKPELMDEVIEWLKR